MQSDNQVLYQAHLLEHLPAAVISTDAQFIILSWNHEAEKIYGWKAEEVVGKYAQDFLQPQDKEIYSVASIKELFGKGFWNGFVHQQHKQGTGIFIETSVKLLHDRLTGTFEGTVSVNKDITRQRELERELLFTQGRLDAAIRSSYVTISNQDKQLRYTYLHKAQHDVREEDAIGKTDEEALPEALSRQVVPIKKRVLQTGQGEQHEVSFGHSTGNYSYLLTIDPLFNEQQETIGLTTAAINISSLKHLESSLLERDSQLHHLTNSLPVLISYVDAQERYRFVNHNYQKWFGIPKDFMLGKTLHEVAGDVFYEKHKPYYTQALAGEMVEFDEIILRQGEKRYLHVHLLPFKDTGKVKGFYVLAQDQTELLTAKNKLEESNQLYEAIIQHFPNGNIFLLDREYNITFAQGKGMLERAISPDVFMGKHISAFFEKNEQWERHYADFKMVLSGETIIFNDFVMEQHYEFTATPLPDKHGQINRILCIVRNISEQVKLEEKVRRYTANLQEAQQLARLGFWEYYTGENKMVWSDMIYQFFKLNPAEPIPPPDYFLQMIASSDREEMQQVINKASEENIAYQFKLSFKLPDGELKYLQIYGKPPQSTTSGQIRRFGVAIDITEQYLLEEKVKEQEARMHSLFESDTVGIIFWDINGRITHANNYFLRLIGYSRQELEAGEINWIKLTPAEWEEKDRIAMQSLLTDSINVTKEKEYFHKSGNRIPVLMGSAFLAGYHNKGASFILDNTELQKIRKELEKKAQELRYSNSELEKFAYVAAHDLQEPLNTLSGLINLLHYQADDALDAEFKKLLDYIQGIIGRMQQLIKNLLEYSKTGSAKINITEFPIEEVVKVVLDSLAKRIEDTGSTIAYENLPTIHADKPQMTQLMQNLIGNAIKFKDTRPMHIEISGQLVEEGWRFCVKDTGIGMDMANASKIFGPFQRLHTRNEYEGTGLGLTICQKIVERHGGSIWVESEPGVGSSFYFTIQKKEQEAG